MPRFLIQAAVYVPAYLAGRLMSDQIGHAFLWGWIIGGFAMALVQHLERRYG